MRVTAVVSAVMGLMALASAAAGAPASAAAPVWDPNGYIYFCPCMGRFGNQIEYYLGVLKLAKAMDRTLVLPPFIEYTRTGGRRFPRFSEYFQVSEIARYQRVIEAHKFIAAFGGDGQPWAPEKRVAYCWGNDGDGGKGKAEPKCEVKRGQPSTDFWALQGLDFTRFAHYNLNSRTEQDPSLAAQWRARFPASTHPVVAFSGAPAPLPMDPANWPLQQYLVWSKTLQARARKFIAAQLPRPYVGVHMRVGSDWKGSCEHAVGLASYMSAVQCLKAGETITQELCYQSKEQIVYAVQSRVHATGARSVFVATDDADYLPDLQRAMPDVAFVRYRDRNGYDHPATDLVLLGESDHFIGNCVSSFTAMIKRQRDIQSKPSTWFGYGDEPVAAPKGGSLSADKKKRQDKRRRYEATARASRERGEL